MKSSDGWRHMAKVRFAESFVQDLVDKVSAKSKRDEIRAACSLLEDFPEIGSPCHKAGFCAAIWRDSQALVVQAIRHCI